MHISLYIRTLIVYNTGEQSRESRVKCRQNGELCDGRRVHARDGVSAPAAPYWGRPPLCSNDTQSGKRSAIFCCATAFRFTAPLPALCRKGSFFTKAERGRSLGIFRLFRAKIFGRMDV